MLDTRLVVLETKLLTASTDGERLEIEGYICYLKTLIA